MVNLLVFSVSWIRVPVAEGHFRIGFGAVPPAPLPLPGALPAEVRARLVPPQPHDGPATATWPRAHQSGRTGQSFANLQPARA